MTKKEKIIAVCFAVSMALVLISAVYTIEKNKPEGYAFRYEKWANGVFK